VYKQLSVASGPWTDGQALACLDSGSQEKPHNSAPKQNFKNFLKTFLALM